MAKGYGGIINSLLKGMANVAAREMLVQMGRKKPHRGGIKITKTRKIIQGRDKYGRKGHSKKKG